MSTNKDFTQEELEKEALGLIEDLEADGEHLTAEALCKATGVDLDRVLAIIAKLVQEGRVRKVSEGWNDYTEPYEKIS
jgi:DNA-binding IclR family transcriptional regulator